MIGSSVTLVVLGTVPTIFSPRSTTPRTPVVVSDFERRLSPLTKVSSIFMGSCAERHNLTMRM
jgi:hypothetical protein